MSLLFPDHYDSNHDGRFDGAEIDRWQLENGGYPGQFENAEKPEEEEFDKQSAISFILGFGDDDNEDGEDDIFDDDGSDLDDDYGFGFDDDEDDWDHIDSDPFT